MTEEIFQDGTFSHDAFQFMGVTPVVAETLDLTIESVTSERTFTDATTMKIYTIHSK